ncbi:MAG: acyltransferase family protein [Bacilli bacterium]|nr:acyltransferase family protein [Bacilli bacterium]
MEPLIKNRSHAQDIAKCLLIVAVVAFHALMIVYSREEVAGQFNPLLVMFPFLLGVFFFYSGYNYNPGKRTFGENLKRRTLQLLVPMVVCTIVDGVLVGLFVRFGTGESWNDISDSFLNAIMGDATAIMTGFAKTHNIIDLVELIGLTWFIYVLYFASIPFYLLVDYTNKKLSRLISVVTGVLLVGYLIGQFVPFGTYLPYGLNSLPVALALMLTAAYLKQTNFLDRPHNDKKSNVLGIINILAAWGIIIGTGLICYYAYNTTLVGSLMGGSFNAKLKGLDCFLAFLFGILGTYIMHQIGRAMDLLPGVRVALTYVGERSALLYLTHPIFLAFFDAIVFHRNLLIGPFQPYLYTIGTVLMFVIYRILWEMLLNRIKMRASKEKAQKAQTKEIEDNGK